MNIKKKKIFMISVIILSFFVVSIVSNHYSLENAKNACVKNNKTPKIEQDFLAINWTVSCV
jgi:CHASE3 domain sensor protein